MPLDEPDSHQAGGSPDSHQAGRSRTWQLERALRAIRSLAAVTSRQRDALRRAQQLQSFHIEHMPLGHVVWDLDFRVVQWNRAAEHMFGWPAAEVQGRVAYEFLVPPDARDEVRSRWAELLAGQSWNHFIIPSLPRDGSRILGEWFNTTLRDDRGRIVGVASMVQDVSELERQLARARHYGEPGAVIFPDLDGFKEINESRGHRVGDEVLAKVGAFLWSRLRETDAVARLGGDEFAVLLTRMGPEEAKGAAGHLLQGLRGNLATVTDVGRGGITASIGTALFSSHGPSVDELLSRADAAMYKAKEAGGNRAVVYDEADGAAARPGDGRRAWERRIRRALRKEGFVLYAQPIYDLKRGQVSQYELLLRLVDERGQIVLPGNFLGIAERSGLIHEIDRWVVQQAIRLIAEHAREGQDVCLEVNLSALAFSDDQLLPLISRQLEQAGVRPENLVLEITETAAIRDMHQARALVQTLKRLGCRFALDDFGVGFGSFYYLKHLPVDYVKIDGSFIRNLGRDPVDPHIVRAIVEVAVGLGIRTIAEFVEEQQTMDLLMRYGVDYAQGYFVGHPRPVHEVLGPTGLAGLPQVG